MWSIIGNCETHENPCFLCKFNKDHKQVLWDRRYLGGVLWHLMYRYEAKVAKVCLRWFV